MRHYAIEKCIQQKSLRPLVKRVKGIFKLDEEISLPKSTDISVSMNLDGGPVPILCTGQTGYVAELIRHSLAIVGVESEIIVGEPAAYSNRVYVVICPQVFKALPDKYIVFQMEQIMASNWMTKKYKRILSKAYYVFDYSLLNIKHFRKDPDIAGRFFYLPIDFLPGMRRTDADYEYDVVFYGDPCSPRRQSGLEKLQKHFNVKIISETFGEELYDILAKAKVVVNLHYYENALLETTRLYETLSLGRSVIVSERSCDSHEEQRLEGLVDFVGIGDVDAMTERVDYWLSHEDERLRAVDAYYKVLLNHANAFDFYFLRFLLANDWLSFDKFYSLAGDFVHFNSDRVCLSLPETVERTEYFNSVNKYGFEIMPGLRHYRGWTGCGLSYKFIMAKAKEQGFDAITVCEDDVYFPDDFESRFAECEKYLDENPGWDLFQGLNADIRDAVIKKTVRGTAQTFVHINRMLSTVFNRYSNRVFDIIIGWNEHSTNPTEAIEYCLELEDINVVITDPFLVGHNEKLDSSAWGFKNTEYISMIGKSSQNLSALVTEFENSSKAVNKK